MDAIPWDQVEVTGPASLSLFAGAIRAAAPPEAQERSGRCRTNPTPIRSTERSDHTNATLPSSSRSPVGYQGSYAGVNGERLGRAPAAALKHAPDHGYDVRLRAAPTREAAEFPAAIKYGLTFPCG